MNEGCSLNGIWSSFRSDIYVVSVNRVNTSTYTIDIREKGGNDPYLYIPFLLEDIYYAK